MSRTYKDLSYKYDPRRVAWDHDRYKIEYPVVKTHSTHYDPQLRRYVQQELNPPIEYTAFVYLQAKTTRTKKRKNQDTEYRWMTTPSWWTRLTMNRPQRRQGRMWERKVLVQDIEETDPPGVSRKPHKYYW